MTVSSLMTPEVNLALTALLCDADIIRIGDYERAVGVWLPGTQDYDPPNGKGDTVFEALADAVYNSLKEKRKHV